MLTKKIPIKKIPEGELHFQILAKHQKTEGQMISVYPDEPFRYICQLQNAYLRRVDGQVGIILPE